jgi:hypothetical protein
MGNPKESGYSVYDNSRKAAKFDCAKGNVDSPFHRQYAAIPGDSFGKATLLAPQIL